MIKQTLRKLEKKGRPHATNFAGGLLKGIADMPLVGLGFVGKQLQKTNKGNKLGSLMATGSIKGLQGTQKHLGKYADTKMGKVGDFASAAIPVGGAVKGASMLMRALPKAKPVAQTAKVVAKKTLPKAVAKTKSVVTKAKKKIPEFKEYSDKDIARMLRKGEKSKKAVIHDGPTNAERVASNWEYEGKIKKTKSGYKNKK
jgi:hypothetical protein